MSGRWRTRQSSRGRVTGWVGIAVITFGAGLALVATAASQPSLAVADAAEPADPDFVDEQVLTGSAMTVPTSVSFSTDGHVFVAQKDGRILWFDGPQDASGLLVADLRPQVLNFGDRGLLGFALHPDFPETPEAYALYTADGLASDTVPRPGANDSCANPCIASATLSRLDWDGVGFTEMQLVRGWCQIFFSHSIADVALLPDGSIVASAGDAAVGDFNNSSCPEPANEGGSMRAQDVRTSSDPIDYLGSIIRVNRTGQPVNGTTAEDRLIAHGLRNPFRIEYSHRSGQILVADVGEDHIESVDMVNPFARSNHGWPCFEGTLAAMGTNLPLCESLDYGDTAEAVWTYDHADEDITSTDAGRCGPGQEGNSLGGIVEYQARGTNPYPAQFHGAVFVADYARRCIWALATGADGRPTGSAQLFASDVANPIELEQGPDGSLYYIDAWTSTVRRIRYTGAVEANQAPVIDSATATPSRAVSPASITFEAAASDPDDDVVTLSWDTDTDGIFDSEGPTVTRTFDRPGTYTAVVRATDPFGAAITRQVNVTVVGTVSVDITTASGWSIGEPYTMEAVATDPIAPETTWEYEWTLRYLHCDTVDQQSACHRHELTSGSGPTMTINPPDHPYPTSIEASVVATSTEAGSLETIEVITPEISSVAVASSPSGITIADGNGPVVTPFGRTVIRGGSITLSAPSSTMVAGAAYRFVSWSTGATSASITVAISSSLSLTAIYEPLEPPPTTTTHPPTTTTSPATTTQPPTTTTSTGSSAGLSGALLSATYSASHNWIYAHGWAEATGQPFAAIDVSLDGTHLRRVNATSYATGHDGHGFDIIVNATSPQQIICLTAVHPNGNRLALGCRNGNNQITNPTTNPTTTTTTTTTQPAPTTTPPPATTTQPPTTTTSTGSSAGLSGALLSATYSASRNWIYAHGWAEATGQPFAAIDVSLDGTHLRRVNATSYATGHDGHGFDIIVNATSPQQIICLTAVHPNGNRLALGCRNGNNQITNPTTNPTTTTTSPATTTTSPATTTQPPTTTTTQPAPTTTQPPTTTTSTGSSASLSGALLSATYSASRNWIYAHGWAEATGQPFAAIDVSLDGTHLRRVNATSYATGHDGHGFDIIVNATSPQQIICLTAVHPNGNRLALGCRNGNNQITTTG